MFILANSSVYDKLGFDRIVNNLGKMDYNMKVEYLVIV